MRLRPQLPRCSLVVAWQQRMTGRGQPMLACAWGRGVGDEERIVYCRGRGALMLIGIIAGAILAFLATGRGTPSEGERGAHLAGLAAALLATATWPSDGKSPGAMASIAAC